MSEQIAVVALVAVGLAYTLARLDGPFGLATWLKGVMLNAAWAPGWLQQRVECAYCWSFWLTLVITVLSPQSGVLSLSDLVQVWLAAYGLAVVLLWWAGH
jgi:hypothetical protein